MTAHAIQGDKDKCLQAGMDDYISKPINPKKLSAVIEKYTLENKNELDFKNIIQDKKFLNSDVFDKKFLLKRIDGDRKLYDEIIEIFIDDIPQQFQKLRVALDEKDALTVQRQGHTIKGASANVGADALREIAYKIECAAEKGELDDVEEYFEIAKEKFKILLVELNADRESIPAEI